MPLPVATEGPPPGRWRAAFRTHDPDAARQHVAQLYGAHALELRPRAEIDLRLSGFDLGGLNVSRIQYGCPAVARNITQRDFWAFALLVQGRSAVGHQPAHVGDASALDPDDLRRIPMSSDMRLVNLRVTMADMDEACRVLLGSDRPQRLRFDAYVPGGSPAAQWLAGLAPRLAAVPAVAHPMRAVLERRWQEAALLELLMVWPHAQSQQLARTPEAPGAVQRAIDYIEAHLDQLPTLGDITRAVGVGARALSRGFDKRLGVSPMRFVLQRRLDRARAELLDAVGGASVADIACHWGFANLGDFAAHYRERFGELPRESLARAKSRRP
ncbi:MAG: AraC family transcriptional regulator [Pseudomonadota bacterium]